MRLGANPVLALRVGAQMAQKACLGSQLVWSAESQFALSSLFANGEQGILRESFSTFDGLYQDSAGTLPVTGYGQPVGLVIDHSKGLVVGPEITPPVPIGPASVVSDNGVLTVTTLSNTSGAGLSIATLALGKLYKVRYRARVLDVGTVCTVQGAVSHPQLPTDGSFATFDGLALGNGGYIYFRMPDGQINKRVEVSEYSVRELPGNHLIQSTPTKRPILRQDSNGIGYLDWDGIDDAMQTAATVDFTATDQMFISVGLRKLDDTPRILVEFGPRWFDVGATGPVVVTGGTTSYFSTSKSAAASYASNQVAEFSTNQYLAPDSCILTADNSISSDLSRIWRNGIKSSIDGTGDKGAGNYLNAVVYIGARGGTSLYFKGRMYSLVIRGAATDDATRGKVIARQNQLAGGLFS